MTTHQQQTLRAEKGWVQVRVAVSDAQRVALEKLADETGASIATCVRLAATEYVRRAHDTSSRSNPYTGASLRAMGRRTTRSEGVHLRLPQQLRQQLLDLEAQTGLNMLTQLRLAVTEFLAAQEPGAS